MKAKNINRVVVISVALCLIFFSSCSFYRVIPEKQYDAETIKKYDYLNKYIVLKRDQDAWHMYDVQLRNDSITARLDYQLGYQVNHLNPKTGKLNQFHKKFEPEVLKTVHLYTSDSSFNAFDTLIAIPASSIYQVNTFVYAAGPSRASWLVPVIVFPVAITFVIIAAVTVSTARVITKALI